MMPVSPFKESTELWIFSWTVELRCEMCGSFFRIGSSRDFYRYMATGRCAFCETTWGSSPDECKELIRSLFSFLSLKKELGEHWEIFFEIEEVTGQPNTETIGLRCRECGGTFGVSTQKSVVENLKGGKQALENRCPFCGKIAEGLWELVNVVAEILKWAFWCRDAGLTVKLVGRSGEF